MQSKQTAVRVRRYLIALAWVSVVFGEVGGCVAQSSSGQSGSARVAVVDGGLGPCSADFAVTDPAGKPAQDAKVSVRIAYGFMSLHKLDLEVTTNSEGKARFEGLPSAVKRPLEFRAVLGKLEGVAIDDPAKTCKAQHNLVLHQATAQ